MLKLNTDEKRSLQFEVNIQGINHQELQGVLKFVVGEVEYGFPVKILSDHISVDVPPLDDIVKVGLTEGEVVDCKLDVFGNGFYLNPWSGQFKLKTPVRMEAKMRIADDIPTLAKEKSVEKGMTVTLKEEDVVERHITQKPEDTEEEYGVEAREAHEPDVPVAGVDTDDEEEEAAPVKRPMESGTIDKAELLDMLEEVLARRERRRKETIRSKPLRESKPAIKPAKKASPPPRKTKKQKLVEVVSKTGKRYKVTPDVAERLQEVSNVVDRKLKKKPVKKKVVESRKPKKNDYDPRRLMESRGMKNKAIQDVMIEKAESIAGDDPKAKFYALEKLLGIQREGNLLAEYEQVHDALRFAGKVEGSETEKV